MSRYLSPTTITANTNHPAVRHLAGFSLRESAATAAPATVRLRVGSATGQILTVLELAANESATLTLPSDSPISSPGGVYVEVVAGTVEGVLYEAA